MITLVIVEYKSRTDVFDRSVLSQELCETKPTYENADESFTQTDPGY